MVQEIWPSYRHHTHTCMIRWIALAIKGVATVASMTWPAHGSTTAARTQQTCEDTSFRILMELTVAYFTFNFFLRTLFKLHISFSIFKSNYFHIKLSCSQWQNMKVKECPGGMKLNWFAVSFKIIPLFFRCTFSLFKANFFVQVGRSVASGLTILNYMQFCHSTFFEGSILQPFQHKDFFDIFNLSEIWRKIVVRNPFHQYECASTSTTSAYWPASVGNIFFQLIATFCMNVSYHDCISATKEVAFISNPTFNAFNKKFFNVFWSNCQCQTGCK